MTLRGNRIVALVLPMREGATPEATRSIDISANVVPLERVRRTLH